jgi:shikimate 5-dehydrogenase
LFQEWTKKEAETIDGVDLLVHQAISQVEIFSNKTVDRNALSALMRSKALELLERSTGN